MNALPAGPPNPKYHNIWPLIAAWISIALTVLTYVQPLINNLASRDAAMNQQLSNQFSVLSKEVNIAKNEAVECQTQVDAIQTALDKTNVLGAATGSALRKVK